MPLLPVLADAFFMLSPLGSRRHATTDNANAFAAFGFIMAPYEP